MLADPRNPVRRERRGTQWSRPLVTLPVLAATLADAACNRNGHAGPALANIVRVLAGNTVTEMRASTIPNRASRRPTWMATPARGSASPTCTRGLGVHARPVWIADATLLLVHGAATHRAVQQRSASACIGIEAQGLPHGHVRQVVRGLDFAVKDGKQVDLDRLQPWHAGPAPEVGASISLSMPASGGLTDLGFDEALASFRHPAGSWRSGMAAEN